MTSYSYQFKNIFLNKFIFSMHFNIKHEIAIYIYNKISANAVHLVFKLLNDLLLYCMFRTYRKRPVKMIG